MKQQVKGIGSTNQVPTADRARKVLQNVENLYNADLVERVFEDGSIPDSKLVSGGGGGVFAYTSGLGLYGSNNANTVADNAIQIGNGATGAGSIDSVTIGRASTTGTSLKSVNIGVDNIVSGANQSVTVGSNNRVYGQYSMVMGWYCYANKGGGQGGIAIGNSTNADYSGTGTSIAIGQSTQASNGSIAMGRGSRATGLYSIAVGENADSAGARAVALGNQINNAVADTFKLGVSASENLTFDTWTAGIEAAAASTHSLPIKIGASTYRILLTNA